MMNPQFLTPEGMKALEDRLRNLQQVRRPHVAERLRVAMEEGGDLSENAEYDDAKNEQAFIEGEINRLEMILRHAQLIEDDGGKKDRVVLGAHVTVVEKGTRTQEVYHIVSTAEANPDEGKISIESPIGKALLGKKNGEKVTVVAPGGEFILTIKAIK